MKSIIRRFDDNDDGVLQYEEFSQLWMAKRRSAISEDALRRAVVVCGYNEVGQQLCALLDKANIAGIPYVAFARKTEQISASVSTLPCPVDKPMRIFVLICFICCGLLTDHRSQMVLVLFMVMVLVDHLFAQLEYEIPQR